MATDRTRWWGWGDPDVTGALDHRPGFRDLLRAELGARPGSGRPVPGLDAVTLPEPTLEADARAALPAAMAAAGPEALLADETHEARVRHSAGKSYMDLIRLRGAKLEEAPDLVLRPTTETGVRAALDWAAQYRVAVVPFGGGTSVVGGVHPRRGTSHRGLVSLDMRGLARCLDVDRRSRLGEFEAGIMGPVLETALGRNGLTLGHFPQSFEYSTLGGWIAARSSGQCSTGYGRIDDLVATVTVAAPGRSLETVPAVAAATGPSLKQLIVGSEGILGVITRARMRLAAEPAKRRLKSAFFSSFAQGVATIRHLVQEGPRPTLVRLSDEAETEMLLVGAPVPNSMFGSLKQRLGLWWLTRQMGTGQAPCMMVLGFEGSSDDVLRAARRATARLGKDAVLDAGSGPARSWFVDRFRHPYLRDDLIGEGILVETLETATTWSDLESLHRDVGAAVRRVFEVQAVPGRVLCHLSHAYTHGASLYFTVMARAQSGGEIAQWQAIKSAAMEVILSHRAALSHHHGVGLDHVPWMPAHVGPTGISVLSGLRQLLDPAGILNPGKVTSC